MKLLNAFSINMLDTEHVDISTVKVEKISLAQARELAATGKLQSCIGHADTAAVVSNLLGTAFPSNRTTIVMGNRETALVAQYVGPRLPEGTSVLPEGARITWYLVEVTQ